ncbi:MAG: hypothetical protein JST26_12950 [Bacteroidetes bacterium]|nr:hypothetical protein [Bacteroidota bacterium]
MLSLFKPAGVKVIPDRKLNKANFRQEEAKHHDCGRKPVVVFCSGICGVSFFKESGQKEEYLVEQYNNKYKVSIQYRVIDEGFMDMVYGRDIYLINRETSDSVKVNLYPSQYIGFYAFNAAGTGSDSLRDVIVFCNIDESTELVFDAASMREIKDPGEWGHFRNRYRPDTSDIYFNIQPLPMRVINH